MTAGATRLVHATPDEDNAIRAWADRLAAQLPPLTPAEAAELGRLAAILDARGDAQPARRRAA